MKKLLLAVFLLTAGLTTTYTANAQVIPTHQIPVLPPKVQQSLNEVLAEADDAGFDLVINDLRYFVEKGTFVVYLDYELYFDGSIREADQIYIYFSPKGELLGIYL